MLRIALRSPLNHIDALWLTKDNNWFIHYK